MRSNCLAWVVPEFRKAVRAWVEAGMPAGQEPCIVIRPSRLQPRWVPHFLLGHLRGEVVTGLVSFKPLDSSPLPWWRVLQALWFLGHVVRGDLPEYADTVLEL